jgi:hypothetical protein
MTMILDNEAVQAMLDPTPRKHHTELAPTSRSETTDSADGA